MIAYLENSHDMWYCWSPDHRDPGIGRTHVEARQNFCDKNLAHISKQEMEFVLKMNLPLAKMPHREPEPTTPGIKLDQGKLMWHLLPLNVMEEVVQVMQDALKKYPEYNWTRVEALRYYDSACRHFFAYFWKGERFDKESGHSHLAHLICNIIFLLWKDKHGEEVYALFNKLHCVPVDDSINCPPVRKCAGEDRTTPAGTGGS